MAFKSKKKEKAIWTSTTGLPKWSQSPIDLNRMYLLHQRFPYLLLQGHLSNLACPKMTNTGNTVKIEFEGERQPSLLGGPLAAEYQFSDMQFRWGASNARGAEHSIDGLWFSMEAQMMHWNKGYGSIDKCYEKSDGFAAIAFLFQVTGCPSMEDNPNFACITDALPLIKIPEQCTQLPPDCFKWLREVCSEPGYYSYNGSFTTDPFQERVTWIVIPRPIRISANQINAFRNLYNHTTDCILTNCRSEQKVHDRKIFFATDE